MPTVRLITVRTVCHSSLSAIPSPRAPPGASYPAMRRTYAAHLQCHHLPPVRKILHGPIAQVQVLSWLPEGKTQAYRCRPTGREALPCLIPTTSPPPFCSKNRAKRRLFFYTTLPNLRSKMRMPGCTVPRSMAAGTAQTANTRLYQRMPWPPWYATGLPVPRLPGHVRKGWTSPSASSLTGMMTMAAAAGRHGQRHRPTWARMPAGGSG